MDTLSYFATQSPITEPGSYSDQIAAMPKDAAALCEAIQGLYLNYKTWYQFKTGTEQILQSNDHYVRVMLRNVLDKDKSPLTQARDDGERVYASAADYVSLFCAVMRANGTPARKRVGFKLSDAADSLKYGRIGFEKDYAGDYYVSYDVAEYWNGTAWEQVDAAGMLGDCKFVSAAEAWQAWRKGEVCACTFHNDPSAGEIALRSCLMLDLAAVNKMELLGWDRYGWMTTAVGYLSDRALAVLDEVAELLLDVDKNLEALQAVYTREEGLEVPNVLLCAHPIVPAFKFDFTVRERGCGNVK